MAQMKDNNGVLEMPSDPKFDPSPLGFGAYCFNKMKEFSEKIAQTDVDTNKSETYGTVLKKSIRIALKMKSMGITNEDIISLCTDNHIETCLPFWATCFLGAKLSNLDPTLEFVDMKYLTNLIKPKIIFCIPESVDVLETVIKELNLDTKLVVFGETNNHIPFASFLEPQQNEENFQPKIVDVFDTAFILFSSGTTGLPKGICITHYGMVHAVKFYGYLHNTKTVLYYTSPYWVSYTLFMSMAVEIGGQKIICRKFDAKKVLQLVEKYKVTFLFLPPSFAYAMVANSYNDKNTYDTSSLYTMLIGGGITAKEQVYKLRKILPHTLICDGYGFTELCSFSIFDPRTDADMIRNKIGSCGKMGPDTTCKVVDIETNKVVGANQRGELLVKSKRLMNGYYNNPEKTAEVIDKDGFLHTGDVVYYDEDYCFYVVDRIKEMFKYKSWHIVPAELENILLKHPSVNEVMVIGRPDEEDGDHPMAVIVLKSGCTVTENDILQYFNDQVSDRKKLRGGVKFVEKLPKTPTGKYNRIKLRTMVINNEI